MEDYDVFCSSSLIRVLTLTKLVEGISVAVRTGISDRPAILTAARISRGFNALPVSRSVLPALVPGRCRLFGLRHYSSPGGGGMDFRPFRPFRR